MRTKILRSTVALLSLLAGSHAALAQGTAFTYQGELNDGAAPARGNYDLAFTLFAASSGGSPLAGPLTYPAVGISNGLFTVSLDFGANFPGAERWLEIRVQTNGGSAFATLSPRQALTPTPYAVYAAGASAAGLSGMIPAASLPPNAARLDANQIFTGTNSFRERLSGAGVFANYTLGTSRNGLDVKLEMTDSNHRPIASLGGDKFVGGQLFLSGGNLAGPSGRLIISNLFGDAVTRLNGDGSASFLGNVGIGKTNPATALDVAGTVTATAFSGDGAGLTALPANTALLNASQTFTGVNSFNAGTRVNGANTLEFGAGVAGKEQSAGKIGYQTFGPGGLDIVGAGTAPTNRHIRFWAEGGAQFMGAVNAPSANLPILGGNVTVNGNLTSGGPIAAPSATIPNLNGSVSFNGSTRLNGANTLEFGAGVAGKEPSAGKIGYETFGPGALDIVGAGTSPANRQVRFWAEGGSQFMGPVNAPSANIPILSGNVSVNGEVTAKVVTITGGSDVAEPYQVAGAMDVEPIAGMVVSIDPDQIGRMRVTCRAYDKTVAGILSGANGIAPGITLRQAGTIADGSLPVASIGRVWCYCDADASGPIEAGDMLTTSDTAGHAMKAVDSSRANGSVIGKAMSPLKSGRGLVLVFVSLK